MDRLPRDIFQFSVTLSNLIGSYRNHWQIVLDNWLFAIKIGTILFSDILPGEFIEGTRDRYHTPVVKSEKS